MPDGDDLPIFKPIFGKRAHGKRTTSPRGFRNMVLALASLSRPHRATGRRSPARARIAVRPSTTSSRRVVVKVHVAPQRAGGAKPAALHLGYITRDGVEKDGSPGVLYGVDGPLSREVFGSSRHAENH